MNYYVAVKKEAQGTSTCGTKFGTYYKRNEFKAQKMCSNMLMFTTDTHTDAHSRAFWKATQERDNSDCFQEGDRKKRQSRKR